MLSKQVQDNESGAEFVKCNDADITSLTIPLNTDESFELKPKYNKLGICFAFVSSIVTILVTATWKWDSTLPLYEVFTVRSIIGCLISYFLMKFNKNPTPIKTLFSRQNLAIGVCGALSILTYSFSLISLSVSEATTIYATLGIFNGIFGLIFLKEAYPNSEKLLGLICFSGVILIVRPPFLFPKDEEENPSETSANSAALPRYLAAILCIASTALWSLMQVILRGAKSQSTGFASIFQNNFILGVLCMGFLLVRGNVQSLALEGYMIAFLLAIFHLLVAYTIIKALEYEKPSVVGIVGYSQIIFAILADIIVFHILPPPLTIVGVVIIMGSCIFLVKKAS